MSVCRILGEHTLLGMVRFFRPRDLNAVCHIHSLPCYEHRLLAETRGFERPVSHPKRAYLVEHRLLLQARRLERCVANTAEAAIALVVYSPLIFTQRKNFTCKIRINLSKSIPLHNKTSRRKHEVSTSYTQCTVLSVPG
jgi:hypothetical protein